MRALAALLLFLSVGVPALAHERTRVHAEEPIYPAPAAIAGAQANCVVEIDINADGNVEYVCGSCSADVFAMTFIVSLREAIPQWRYAPREERYADDPADRHQIEFPFRLTESSVDPESFSDSYSDCPADLSSLSSAGPTAT